MLAEQVEPYVAHRPKETLLYRLVETQNGQERYELKTPYRDGTTHVIFGPLDFIARLVALIPKPRVNLARYHGVFARGGLPSNSRWRDQVTPGSRGNGAAGSNRA